ncbi:MAG: hypothetical protein IJ009_01650 [Clostridia bacterium]|nr:hypothetical protein [Clostridia bacterium]
MQDEEKRNDQNERNEEDVHQSIAAHLWENRHKTSADAEIVVPLDPVGATAKGRVQNFWYHHKFTAILAVFLAVVLIVCLVQCNTKKEYDIHILYAGPWMECDKATAMESVPQGFVGIMDDYDGNGEKNVAYKPLFLMTEAQIKEFRDQYQDDEENMPNINIKLIQQNMDQLESELMAGRAQICLVDPSVFATMKKSDFLIPLTEFADNLPENDFDDLGVYLSDTAFGQYAKGVQKMPEDTILCFRRVGILNEDKQLSEYHRDMMKKILSFTVAEG